MSGARRPDPGPQGTSRLSGLSGLVTRRPRLVVAVWAVGMLVLALLGSDLGSRLESKPLYIDGSESKRAHEIALRQWGSDESMVVALSGPRQQVSRQGRELAAQIDALPQAHVISPWSAGQAVKGLRPNPETAGIVVRAEHRGEANLSDMLERVEATTDRVVNRPVEASLAGLPKVFESYTEASDHAATRGELIALPLLLIVLLLIFRAVVAALIPVFVGAAVVAGTAGVMRLLLGVVEIDAFALGAAGMMGLALGVDYSLLVVSRFREERGGDLRETVRATVEHTSRSVIPAGLGLLLAMLVASQILPGTVMSSSALAVMIATVLSVVSALCAVPAAIVLLGSNLDRWSLPQRYALRGGALRVSRRVARSPLGVGACVLVLLVLAGWASTLNSGIATPELLPSGQEGRVEGEEVERLLGSGWLAPIEVVVNGRGEPMTSRDRLKSLVAFQTRIERDEGVQTTAGFSQMERAIAPLSGFDARMASLRDGLPELGDGVERAELGARQSTAGLYAAAAGARQLESGAQSANAGTDLLVEGLGAASLGSDQLSTGLNRASSGSDRLAEKMSVAGDGSRRLTGALEEASAQVREAEGNTRSLGNAMRTGEARLDETEAPLTTAEDRLAAAWQALRQMNAEDSTSESVAAEQAVREASRQITGRDPETGEQIGPTDSGVGHAITRARRQFDLGLYLVGKSEESNETAEENTGELTRISQRLDDGIGRLSEGLAELSEGIERLDSEGAALSPALRRLRDGTESLGEHLGRFEASTGEFGRGLADGARSSEQLVDALQEMSANLNGQSTFDDTGLQRLREQSPGLFRSGYFYLAGLDGSPPARRQQAALAVDLDRGGHTARLLVVPNEFVTTDSGRRTLERVREDAADYAEESGAEVVVGGLTANQVTVDDALRDRTALARLALMLVTLIVLIPVLRSLIVPIIAAFLNLLTVSASLGMLAILFDGSLLGGPGYVDSAVIPATMMVMFGLAIDYEVFIFARMREEYQRTGSTQTAIENGLTHSAPVVTGAALIMISVFLAFSLSAFITLRNFGVAQATGVFIDAFIIRLILMPAIMMALGRWSWWMPAWLDRLLPGGGPAPGPAGAERAT